MRDIEHAGVIANLVMFFNLRAVVDRHVPAAKVDHARAQISMGGIENGLLGHAVCSVEGNAIIGERSPSPRVIGFATLALQCKVTHNKALKITRVGSPMTFANLARAVHLIVGDGRG